MNAVTLRNFSLPLRIATFEKDLFAGFSLVRPPFLAPFRPANKMRLNSSTCGMMR
jgi:hypothetical protein